MIRRRCRSCIHDSSRRSDFPLAALLVSARLRLVDDTVHIEGLEVLSHIGVPDEERVSAQRLTFNITLWPARNFRDLGDDIERAVNYATICDEIKSFIERRRDKLIETLANSVASHLLETFEIRRVMIEL